MQNSSDIQAFKGLLKRVKEGYIIQALFLTPTSPAREMQQVQMLNEANDLGLHVIVQRASRQLHIGDAKFFLQIAHEHLLEQMRGMSWDAIHGLEHVDGFERGKEIRAQLEAKVRHDHEFR